jgi:hypothetical protein
MFTRPILAGLTLSGALFLGSPAAPETFTVLPEQTFDVIQPGPRGDIAIWRVEPPAAFNSIRACARIVRLDPHRLFAPGFSVVVVAGEEVLRLRFINDDRRNDLLPAYIRRESVEAPDTAETSGSRKRIKREVRMGPVLRVGQPFDLGMSWTPDGKVDVMVRVDGRENHVSVALKTAPTKVRVIASSGYWRLTPFEFGNTAADDPGLDPDLRPKAGCDKLMPDAAPDPEVGEEPA